MLVHDDYTGAAYDNGMEQDEINAVDDLAKQMKALAMLIGKLPRHRHYSVAVTNLEQARLWLLDRKKQAPGG